MADSKIGIELEVSGNAEAQLKKVSRAFDVFVGSISASGVEKALGVIADAAGNLFDTFIKDGVKAAEEQEDAINQLNSAFARAGKYTEDASKSFNQFANQVQATTKFQDDQVLSTGALIESLARLDGEGLQGATQAALNLSAALGIDLETAARAVGKAANGETDALKKFGIEVKKGGTDAQTFANALQALNAQFGGAAASQVNTFSGANTLLKNTFGELTESIGNAVVKNNVLIEVEKEAAELFTELTTAADGQQDALKILVGDGIILAIQATNVLVVGLDTLVRVATGVANTFEALGVLLGGTFAAATEALGGNFKGAMAILKDSSADASTAAGKYLTEDTKLGEVSRLLFRLEEAARRGMSAMKDGAETSVTPINNASAAVKNLTEAQIEQGKEGEKLAEQLVSGGPAARNAEQMELIKLQREADLISYEEYVNAELALIQAKHDNELAMLQAAREQNLITEQKYQEALRASQAKFDSENEKAAVRNYQEERKRDQQRLQATEGIFGNMAILAREFGREGFEIAKQFSAAEAVVKGILAVQQALASAPPPFNFILAGTVGAVAALNVAKIESATYNRGVDSVPGFGSRDTVPAMLTPGERVVPKETNKDLTGYLEGQSGTQALLASINAKLSALQNQIIVNVGDKEIINVVRDAINSGRQIEVFA